MVGANHNYFSSMEKEVLTTIPFLLDQLHLDIVDARYDPETMGNSYVTLSSHEFRVRFVRDRGDFWAETASSQDPEKWWNLTDVGELITKTKMAYPADLTAAGNFIREHILALKEALGPGYRMNKVALVKREDERSERYYREHPRSS